MALTPGPPLEATWAGLLAGFVCLTGGLAWGAAGFISGTGAAGTMAAGVDATGSGCTGAESAMGGASAGAWGGLAL